MKEYEYSFKVKNIDSYIEYCKKNNYTLKEETEQTRTLYRKNNGTMARITIKTVGESVEKNLDFKDDILNDEILIERRETKSIDFTDVVAVESILDFLGYVKDNTLKRRRLVYIKNNVVFELDIYEEPEIAYVVAIEGEKKEVDEVYNHLKKTVIE